jgi:hypothetical protein
MVAAAGEKCCFAALLEADLRWERKMHPSEIAARFAAFAWYTNRHQVPSNTAQAEASQFSHENWKTFLPFANQGLGRLLLQVAKTRKARQRRSAA